MLLHLLPHFPSFSLRPEGSGCASKDSHLATNEHTLNRELIISSLLSIYLIDKTNRIGTKKRGCGKDQIYSFEISTQPLRS
jgi:hypothetical protein